VVPAPRRVPRRFRQTSRDGIDRAARQHAESGRPSGQREQTERVRFDPAVASTGSHRTVAEPTGEMRDMTLPERIVLGPQCQLQRDERGCTPKPAP
jgi:hypothetical protein